MAYTSQLSIEIIDEQTGERAVPGNFLVDGSNGLTMEQAQEHHYLLKRAYATLITQMTDDPAEQAKFVKAATT